MTKYLVVLVYSNCERTGQTRSIIGLVWSLISGFNLYNKITNWRDLEQIKGTKIQEHKTTDYIPLISWTKCEITNEKFVNLFYLSRNNYIIKIATLVCRENNRLCSG